MRHTGASCACFIGILALTAAAQDSKPNFTGSWQLNSGKSELHSGKTSSEKLTIVQKGASIHMVRAAKTSDGKEIVTEFNCTTDGKDCDAKGTKVSLWYDGRDLVEMDIGTDVVTKMRMSLAPDGKSINCETSFISPQSDGDKMLLEKL
jgi:hypothetical protein